VAAGEEADEHLAAHGRLADDDAAELGVETRGQIGRGIERPSVGITIGGR
jgi:hypothetical protein